MYAFHNITDIISFGKANSGKSYHLQDIKSNNHLPFKPIKKKKKTKKLMFQLFSQMFSTLGKVE